MSCTRQLRNKCSFSVREIKKKNCSDNTDINGRIILNWILKKYDGVGGGGVACVEFLWLKIVTSGLLL